MQKMLTASSMTLPRYMLAMRPHANSGFCLIHRGPGCSPHIEEVAEQQPPVAPPPGSTESQKGDHRADEAALLADSGPTRPAIAPLPNFHGVRETDFSTL